MKLFEKSNLELASKHEETVLNYSSSKSSLNQTEISNSESM